MINEQILEAFSLWEQVQNDSMQDGDAELSEKVRKMIESEQCWVVNDYAAFCEDIRHSKHPGFLTKYTPEDLKKMNATTYQLRGFEIGYALIPMQDGNVDIVSVHNNEPNIKGVVNSLMTSAKNNGGTQLDHFEGCLSDFYERNGFVEHNRDKWDDQYAPEDWNYEKYGRPDVVYRRLSNGKMVSEMFNSLLNRMG